MGFLGMLLNKQDADAISHDLHQDALQTTADAVARHQKSHRRVERTHDLMGQQAAMLAAIKIQELNDKIAWLEEGIALRDAQITAYRGMRDKLLDMNDPKISESYLYQHWRIEDKALDKLLASGELKRDPRKIKDWREQVGYIPPKQTANEQASEIATPPPLPPFEDLEATGELPPAPQPIEGSRENRGDALPEPTASAQASASATPPPLPSFQDLD